MARTPTRLTPIRTALTADERLAQNQTGDIQETAVLPHGMGQLTIITGNMKINNIALTLGFLFFNLVV